MGLKKSVVVLSVVAALVSASNARAAKQPRSLPPSSKWTADFAPDSCALRRSFASDGKSIILEFNSFTYSDDFQVKAYTFDFKIRNSDPKTRFEPDGTFESHSIAARIVLADGAQAILFKDNVFQNADRKNRPEEEAAVPEALEQRRALRDDREKQITGLRLKDTFSDDVFLETGSLHAPMQIMRDCLADLAKAEGLDPEKLARLSQPAKPFRERSWVHRIRREYPPAMVTEGHVALVDTRLIIDTIGKPIDCKSRNNGQHVEFTATACDGLMKFAQFEPALDEDGKPVKAYWSTSVVYRLD